MIKNNVKKQCIQELSVLEAIVEEDQEDINYYFQKGEYLNRRLSLFYQLSGENEVNQSIDNLIQLIKEWKENLYKLKTIYNKKTKDKICLYSFEEVNEDRDPYLAFSTINHNLACMLCNSKKYELALKYFNESIELKTHLNPYSGGIYLGSLWKITKDKKLLVDKIKEQKRLYEKDPYYWKRVIELKELVSDKEFLTMLQSE
ncbi:hypothetical protein [Haloplasma contractile]|nr:hypothetical protein [Haloplasma contractile]